MSADKASPAAPARQKDADERDHGRLGFFLCWAVVFADIGTSIYYVPGILFNQVGTRAGFFVLLTTIVFIMLTFKYSEVTYRYPQGGGVVTVSATAMRPWVGAVGGMFILVDYFLTAAISCLSGVIYFSVVLPVIGPIALPITLGLLALLGLLNWWGVSESATFSAVGAVIAFVSDVAILLEITVSESWSNILHAFPKMFSGSPLTGVALLTGFAGAFLAFSGLESISQLSPVMKTPRKRTGRLAMMLVVFTIVLTSPLLTIFSTTLLSDTGADPNQFISLLAGKYSTVLGIEVAISASGLLIFASNTAIIGAYHVFLALSRMRFFPNFVEKRNRLRGTPHFSILLATGIPIAVLVAVQLASSNPQDVINLLGDMYAFGLLGAFSLTCLGLDIVRYRERRQHRQRQKQKLALAANGNGTAKMRLVLPNPQSPTVAPVSTAMFALGILTTVLVIGAWSVNLVSKHLATAFGGSVTLIGLAIAYWSYQRAVRRGRRLVLPSEIPSALPGSVLAVLTGKPEERAAIIAAACAEAQDKPVVFFYPGRVVRSRRPGLFETVDPYLDDEDAKYAFSEAAAIAREKGVKVMYFIYRTIEPDVDVVHGLWEFLRPRDTIILDTDSDLAHALVPDRVRHTPGHGGLINHYLKNWQAVAV